MAIESAIPKIAGTVLPLPVWAVTKTFWLFLIDVIACFWKSSNSNPKSYGSELNSPSNLWSSGLIWTGR